MRRPFARALARPLVLAAAAAAIPLVSAAPAAADSIVVGGFPVDVSESPWTVALSSRDRFGGTRAGQFCGGVAVGRTTVLTAAHCLSEDVLGCAAGPRRRPQGHRGPRRTCSRTGVRRSPYASLGQPGLRQRQQRRRLRRAHARRAAAHRRRSSPWRLRGDAAYEAGHGRHGLRLGRHHGRRRLRAQLCARPACTCCPTRACEEAYPGSADGTYLAETMLCAGEAAGRP